MSDLIAVFLRTLLAGSSSTGVSASFNLSFAFPDTDRFVTEVENITFHNIDYTGLV